MPGVLGESWKAYCDRFIQPDGRVIDHKAGGITTSEGQAYAMLRAVWMTDRKTFDKTYTWARNNLNSGVRNDHLWAWKWGTNGRNQWKVLDKAFASDADQDAALALIMASQIWGEDRYLQEARAILSDLWKLGTLEIVNRRYLLAGDSLCTQDHCRINPSYYAPYAYRIFSKFDEGRNWNSLTDTSYYVLEKASSLTQTHLPPDWLRLERKTGALTLGTDQDSVFSYDAFRVYWRVALDRELFEDSRARRYLKDSLAWLVGEWKKAKRLPAVISKTGKGLADYESPEMLAGLMSALQSVRPPAASEIDERLKSGYRQGIWFDRDSYYIQNWAWFGLAVYKKSLGPFEAVIKR
jgi:endoglucanase